MTENSVHGQLASRRRKVVPSWLSLYYEDPIELVEGTGRRVTDAEGRTYLDFFGGILTTMTGHAVPEVVEAVASQAGRIMHTSTLYLSRPMIELSEEIAELSGIPDAKVLLVNSGSEANEAALQLACSARRSNQVLALRHGYHGRSSASMGVTGMRSWSPSSLTPYNVNYVHGGDRYRGPFAGRSDQDIIEGCVADLRDVIDTATSGAVGAFIAEPIQGVGGFVTPPDGFFAAMGEVLANYGIPFISDEVQTGWGRTGTHYWGYQAHGIVPDLLTFAKGLGNGLAIGGVVGAADLMESVSANSISTFGGNPLAATGALANLRYHRDHDLQRNALIQGERLASHLRPLTDKVEAVGEVRGKGLMLAVDLVVPGTNEPDQRAATAVLESTRAAGLLVGKGGFAGNVIRIAPPLSITADEIDEGAGILVDALTSLPAS